MMKKNRITVTLSLAALERDIRDKAFRMARLNRQAAQDQMAADRTESEMMPTEDDTAMLRRAVSQGVAEVVTVCRDYVWDKKHSSDDRIVKDDNITITLMMPLNFNLAGCESLGHAIHSYIVAKAMTEWFRYTAPSRTEEQQALCNALRDEIDTILGARVRMMRGGQSLDVVVEEEPVSNITMTTEHAAQT